MFRSEKLDAWGESIEFDHEVCEATCRFPQQEQFGLVSQLQRAAIPISSNVVEGSGHGLDADLTRFIGIAYGSPMEVVLQLHLGKRQSFADGDTFGRLYAHAEKIARILSGLKSQLQPLPSSRLSTLP